MSKLSWQMIGKGIIGLGAILLIVAFSCKESITATSSIEGNPIFELVPSETSNIFFQNKIEETNLVNYFKYEYLYNGGGVAVGDVNNDGLPDLYFTGNMTANRLYLNKGDLVFDEVTAKAKATYLNDWCTGVTMVDINNDGWLDIYISASGYYADAEVRRNILFVNNGDASANNGIPTFTDKAAAYGIDDIGYSMQSLFFDYDNDGDLDLYVANHPNLFRENAKEVLRKMNNPPSENCDHLYRNDSVDGQIKFTDVSAAAGIVNYSHTLGVVASDFDNDGWIDIYTSNDYQDPDYLYKNRGDGTFVNKTDQALKHMAKFSMGVDASDFNNDGWTDLMAVEMMAEDNERQKTNMAPMNPALFDQVVDYGWGYQYMHNALQLNNGILHAPNRTSDLNFSEISYLAGVATTDWSWCPLFADFDNDGWKDLFVSNGYRRDLLDKDFKKELKEMLEGGTTTYDKIKEEIPASLLPNYIFKNNGDLTFEKKSAEWGLGDLINSNGAAFADLDLDGDLDLVLNNMDTLASLYRNNSMEQGRKDQNYLRIALTAEKSNRQALGAKVTLRTADGLSQYQELTVTRGYQSCVEPILHFGLGNQEQVAELRIQWPDKSMTVLQNVKANQLLRVSDKTSTATTPDAVAQTAKLFQEASVALGVTHEHREKSVDDYAKQVLLPHKLSQLGPGLAVADVTGDGLDDFYIGGSSGHPGELHVQQTNGTFAVKPNGVFLAHRTFEDQGVLFFDADQDGDHDLLVVSGSYEFAADSEWLRPRLYFNNGRGLFDYSELALPAIQVSGSCVSAGDFDKDGDLDLFIGGRLIPGQYPQSPGSILLENTRGTFKEISQKVAPEIGQLGMVTSALWTDYDDDSDLDLIVVGEWMPITIFTNEMTTQSSFTKSTIPNSAGWWNSISGGDIDNDGDTDYLLGNLGTNSKNKASVEHPFHVYGDDFDENGNFDIVLGYYYEGTQYPVRGLQCSSEQIPDLKKKIPSYAEFGLSSIEDVYGSSNLDQSLHLQATTFASALLKNEANGLQLQSLPNAAQFAPVNGTIVQDFDGDGCLDVLVGGNQYPVEVETGRYDALKGLFLKGDCQGDFSAIPYKDSGFLLDTDAKALSLIGIGTAGQPSVVATSNQGKTLVFNILRPNTSTVTRMQDPQEFIVLPNGSKRKVERYYGSGYLSQQANLHLK